MTQVRIGIGLFVRSVEAGRPLCVVRCCVRILSFSVNALAQGRPYADWAFPKTAVSIALSKSIISATMDESGGSGSYEEQRNNHSSSRMGAATSCF